MVNLLWSTVFRLSYDWWRPLLSYWYPCNHEAKGSMQGKKGIIGKGDWCLESRWTLWCDCSYVRTAGFVLCVWGGSHVALKIMRWALEIFLWSVTSDDFVLFSCHYLISVNISSISSLVVLNGEEEDVTVHVIIFSMYTLKFVYEKLQHTTYTHLFWIALLLFFGKTVFTVKYLFRTRYVVNVNM